MEYGKGVEGIESMHVHNSGVDAQLRPGIDASGRGGKVSVSKKMETEHRGKAIAVTYQFMRALYRHQAIGTTLQTAPDYRNVGHVTTTK